MTGHIQLEKAIAQAEEQKQLKFIVFINCGSRIDLTSKWFYLDRDRKIKTVLLDAHRPVHHRNMNAAKQIVIIGGD